MNVIFTFEHSSTFGSMNKPAPSSRLNQLIWICRIAFFINYFWFGILKFFPQMSPAEDIAMHTLEQISLNKIPGTISIYLLASLEVFIAVSFLINRFVRTALWLMIVHMTMTFSTFFFFPEEMFKTTPFGLTLLSQYVIKNLVFISVGLLILNLTKDSKKSNKTI